jgi:hypothetical protein
MSYWAYCSGEARSPIAATRDDVPSLVEAVEFLLQVKASSQDLQIKATAATATNHGTAAMRSTSPGINDGGGGGGLFFVHPITKEQFSAESPGSRTLTASLKDLSATAMKTLRRAAIRLRQQQQPTSSHFPRPHSQPVGYSNFAAMSGCVDTQLWQALLDHHDYRDLVDETMMGHSAPSTPVLRSQTDPGGSLSSPSTARTKKSTFNLEKKWPSFGVVNREKAASRPLFSDPPEHTRQPSSGLVSTTGAQARDTS